MIAEFKSKKKERVPGIEVFVSGLQARDSSPKNQSLKSSSKSPKNQPLDSLQTYVSEAFCAGDSRFLKNPIYSYSNLRIEGICRF